MIVTADHATEEIRSAELKLNRRHMKTVFFSLPKLSVATRLAT